jgi:hypothetical protein
MTVVEIFSDIFKGYLKPDGEKPFVQGSGRCSSRRTAESGSNKPPELMNAITLAGLKKLPEDSSIFELPVFTFIRAASQAVAERQVNGYILC